MNICWDLKVKFYVVIIYLIPLKNVLDITPKKKKEEKSNKLFSKNL